MSSWCILGYWALSYIRTTKTQRLTGTSQRWDRNYRLDWKKLCKHTNNWINSVPNVIAHRHSISLGSSLSKLNSVDCLWDQASNTNIHLCWCFVILLLMVGYLKSTKCWYPALHTDTMRDGQKMCFKILWACVILGVYRAQCVQVERGKLLVTVLISSTSRTQTVPLWTRQVCVLPCCQSPGRKPPTQPNTAKPADNDKRGGGGGGQHTLM